MGTAIVIDTPDGEVDEDAIERAFAHFRDVDTRFSTYKESV